MYIGPWQEYKLGKQQQKDREGVNYTGVQNERLRAELLKALEASLDPVSAAKAIKAVDATIEQSHVATERASLPTIPTRDRRLRTYRRAGPQMKNQSKLPALNCYPYDGGDSLPSTRSTMSEPIQGTKMLFTPDSRPPSHRERPPDRHDRSHTRSTNYDPTSVLDVLRLQRQQEKQTRADFAGKWKWSTGKLPDTSGNFERACNMDKIHKESFQADRKVERVKKMQEIYMQKGAEHAGLDDSAGEGTGSVTHQINLSPIRARPIPSSSLTPPRTPVVRDKDLTDEDYAVVSKYFTMHSKPAASPLRSPSKLCAQPSVVSLDSSAQLGTPAGKSEYSSSRNIPTYPHIVRALSPSPRVSGGIGDMAPSRPPLSALTVPDDSPIRGNGSVYSRGGMSSDVDMSLVAPSSPDGLLNWSAALNADLIDSMF